MFQTGGLPIREVKDKILEHATKMLTSEVRGILKSKSAVSPIPTSSPSPENESKLITTILKSESANGFQDSSSEDEGVSSESTETSDTDDKKDELDEINFKVPTFKISKENSFSEKENQVLVNNMKNVQIFSEVKVRKHLEEVQQISSSTEGTPQTSDGESSGGREVKKIISNDAVARRRQAAINRQKEK